MKNSLIVLLLISAIFSSCKKDEPTPKPKAEFTYNLGTNGQVYFNNVSTDATTYSWDFGDFTTSSQKDLVHTYTKNGIFQVSLTATGNGGNDVIVKSVEVTNIKGDLMVFNNTVTGTDAINIWVDEVYKGFINGRVYYLTSPDCGNSNSVTVLQLSPGEHTVRGQDFLGTKQWQGKITIIGGKCNKLGLN